MIAWFEPGPHPGALKLHRVVRNVSFIVFAIVTLCLGVLGAITEERFRLLAYALAAIGAGSAIALAFFDSRNAKRSEALLNRVLDAVSDAAVSPSGSIPSTFREQAFAVLREMEQEIHEVGEHPSDDQEYELTLEYANRGTLARARRVRIKAQTFLGYTNDISTLIRTFPIGLRNLQIIARASLI